MNVRTDSYTLQVLERRMPEEGECSSAISCLPFEMILEVFSYLSAVELCRCQQVSREWRLYVDDEGLWKKLLPPSLAFGRQEWLEYFGDCGEEPPLPREIHRILKSPCPFWPGKRVEETHLLTLIPKRVDGRPLTLTSLGELVVKPKRGYATQYSYEWSKNSKKVCWSSILCTEWVLVTKEVIPESLGKGFTEQRALLDRMAKQNEVKWLVPSTLEVAVCLFTHYVKTQEHLLSDRLRIIARCQEKVRNGQVLIGHFSAYGLYINPCRYYSLYNIGIMAVRRFFNPLPENDLDLSQDSWIFE